MTLQREILRVENLSVSFHNKNERVKAINNISFSLNEGETLGIVGESGSGKSVTALSIIGLLDQNAVIDSSSKILLSIKNGDGERDLTKINETRLNVIRGAEISMIFQDIDNALNPSYKCGLQVAEAIVLHQSLPKDEAKAKVLDLFEQVSLNDPLRIFNAYPHELSGGQIQRVMIAMAISSEAKILIADEPTTALDVTVQKSILELLEEVKKQTKCAVIFISHDLAVVNEIADRVLVLYRGQIVEEGNTSSVFRNPSHPYTEGLIACRPVMNRRVRILPTIKDYLTNKTLPQSNVIDKANCKERLELLKSKQNIIEINHLSKFYPKTKNILGKPTSFIRAIDNVSLYIREGETLGLVGESGSGKSTLAKVMLNLIQSDFGQVFFEGKNVFEMDKRTLKKMRKDYQIIFQNPFSSLNPKIRVRDSILEPMEIHDLYENSKGREDKVDELLRLVDLDTDIARRFPHELSGGQRQRICIARSLSLNPKFIVCDECVSSLDVSVQAQILNLLVELRNKLNLSYLFISHDLSVVKHMSDRILVMERGRIVEENEADLIYDNPQHSYTKMLINSIPKGID